MIALQEKWGFENILLLSSYYQETKTDPNKAAAKKKTKREFSDERLYHKPEEECYAKVCMRRCVCCVCMCMCMCMCMRYAKHFYCWVWYAYLCAE